MLRMSSRLTRPKAPKTERMSRARIATTFLRVGALAYGGLGATIALLERELVERKSVLTRGEIADALTHTKLLPGSTVVQVIAYIGWRLGGWLGSAVATACFILPSALLMLALAYGYAELVATPAAVAARRGVLAVVVALLLVTMAKLTAQVIKTPFARAAALVAFGIVALFPSASPWVVVSAGIVGLVACRDVR